MFVPKKTQKQAPIRITNDPQLARVIARNELEWQLATQRIAVDIRKRYNRK